jgi:hypothetical protein
LLEQKLDHVAGIGQNFNWQPLAVGTDSTKKKSQLYSPDDSFTSQLIKFPQSFKYSSKS